MHREAMDFLRSARLILPHPDLVCELGSRNVNGSPRCWYSNSALYVGVDIAEGKDVDVVADAATWRSPEWLKFDLVICTEVLEHAPKALEICKTALDILQPGGAFVVTCAGPSRRPHSAVDGGELRPGEFYHNPSRDEFDEWLGLFEVRIVHDRDDQDFYAIAIKGP